MVLNKESCLEDWAKQGVLMLNASLSVYEKCQILTLNI